MEAINNLPEINEILQQPLIIPVIEEQVTVMKDVIETGSITIAKHVMQATEAIHIPLLHDAYEVQHIAINAFVDDVIPVMRQEDNVTIIPVLQEVMVKRIMLVEEIRITRHITETTDQREVTLRKETVTIERENSKET